MIIISVSDDFRLITCVTLVRYSLSEEPAKLCHHSVSMGIIS